MAIRLSRVIDRDLIAAGRNFVREMIGYTPPVLVLACSTVRRGLSSSFKEGLVIEADLNTPAFRTADAAEGIAGFIEKRKTVVPGRWKGKAGAGQTSASSVKMVRSAPFCGSKAPESRSAQTAAETSVGKTRRYPSTS